MSLGIESPRIAAFRRAARAGLSGALDDLRADLAAAAGPLVEPIEGEDQDVLVTFCWLGPAEGVVSLRCQLLESDTPWPSGRLQRVEGTEVWFLTTRAARGARITYQFALDDPFLELDDRAFIENFDELVERELESLGRCYADPANPRRLMPLAVAETDLDVDEVHWESILALDGPVVPSEEAAEPRAPGSRQEFRLRSAALGNERDVTVWTPHGVQGTDAPLPLVVVLDGNWWLRAARLDEALAELTATGRIPPLAAAFVHNPSAASRLVEMACNPDLNRTLCDELLPSVRERVAVATNPRRVAILGASYGGLAASFAAYERPDCFGNAISLSGSYWWGRADPKSRYSLGRDHEPEWLTRRVAAGELKDVRFWLEVGTLEDGPDVVGSGVTMLACNRHFRTVLRAKGYDVHYSEPSGGHDFASWKPSAVAALRWFAAGA
ncbi:MAG TPA: alpha/beta hydrolase-fold protein [Gaiellaceae bacterium]|nr:alpha/beta hydrolase-fold protein [Gaiellaceae bacterium]